MRTAKRKQKNIKSSLRELVLSPIIAAMYRPCRIIKNGTDNQKAPFGIPQFFQTTSHNSPAATPAFMGRAYRKAVSNLSAGRTTRG